MTLAYLVIRSFIADPAGFAHSRHITTKLYESFGARFLVRSDQLKTPSGVGADFALTVAEFPSMAAVDRLLASPESSALQQAAKRKAALDIWAAAGVEVPERAPPAPGARAYILCHVPQDAAASMPAVEKQLAPFAVSRTGRYLIRSTGVRNASGTASVHGLLFMEFPSMEHLRDAFRLTGGLDIPETPPVAPPFDLWIAPGMPPV